MQRIFKNQYKRHDIFACHHAAHHRFGGEVSTYYILEEKKCHPEGCINFIWRCRLLNKGHACPKKYTHEGRKCFSCKQFFEEKYQQTPQLKISPEAYQEFLREKEDFDHWVESHRGRLVELDGEIIGLKPDLIMLSSGVRPKLNFRGWLLVFKRIYINYDLFEDIAFAQVGRSLQERIRFAQGDQLEARARFGFQRGRLILNHLQRIEFKSRGKSSSPAWNETLTAAQMATAIPAQPEKCILCPDGVLVESDLAENQTNGPRRRLICLKGVINPINCINGIKDE